MSSQDQIGDARKCPAVDADGLTILFDNTSADAKNVEEVIEVSVAQVLKLLLSQHSLRSRLEWTSTENIVSLPNRLLLAMGAAFASRAFSGHDLWLQCRCRIEYR